MHTKTFNSKQSSLKVALACATSGLLVAGFAAVAQADPGHGRGPGDDPGTPTATGTPTGTATAEPTKTHTPKPSHSHTPKAPVFELRSVDIHRHSWVNVNAAAKARDIKVRATVRDTSNAVSATSVTVVLAQYNSRRGVEVGTETPTPATPVITPQTVKLDLVRTKKKEARFAGTLTLDRAAIAAALPVGSRALLCLKSADVTPSDGTTVETVSQKVTKKLNGGDCIRIVNVVRTPHS